MSTDGPFHEGERRAQRIAGETEDADHNGRCISDELMAGLHPFVSAQPFVVIARRDDQGRPWAHLLVGARGLLRPSERALTLDLTRAAHPPDDPLLDELRRGGEVGLLVIEPATRRRARINGVLVAEDARTLRVDIRQAFPNCSQYIQRRSLVAGAAAPGPASGAGSASIAAWLAEADTLFVASGHPDHGLDVSHRGGRPGFATIEGATARRRSLAPPGLDPCAPRGGSPVEAEGAIRIPDYPGNSMFNTFGNLLADPRCGLLVPDLRDRARALEVTGRAEIEWASGGAGDPRTGGTGRWWRVTPDAIREVALPPMWTWGAPDPWPRHPPV